MLNDFNCIDHAQYMRAALHEAEQAGIRGDKPIGAVIVHDGKIIAHGSNRFKTLQSHVAHAENTTIFACAPYLSQHSRECILYTTVEPCIMCLGTIVLANIRNVVFSVTDQYMQITSYIEHSPYIRHRLHNYLGGVLYDEGLAVLQKYTPWDAEIILTGRR